MIASEATLGLTNFNTNLLLDIEWKNGQIEGARIYSKTGKAFAEDIVVCYQGKKYSAHIVEGNIDVMNLLPTTV